MLRLLSLVLACALLTGVAGKAGQARTADKFDILGASVNVRVTRNGTTLPATLVPYLQRGDTIDISFPKGVQFSTSPRWHLVVADMHADYLRHPPAFPIADADLSREKPGHVWRVAVKDGATPIIFLVPENGSRYGHGIPDARRAITSLANRSLLLRTATLSANAQAKESTLGFFLQSLSTIQPGQLPDARARVVAAAQSLFGYDLGSSTCFNENVPESTQYACAAQAVASSYQSAPKANVVAALGSQLPITAATYGMLAGTLYQLLAKRRVEADYLFEPGVIKPGGRYTDVYVQQQPSYDASAASPSTIVYFEIGSRATSPQTPAYGKPPALSLCSDSDALDVSVPFSGLPVYFRSHRAIVKAGGKTFDLPAKYDALTGYHAALSSAQVAALNGGGSVRIKSAWGFGSFESAPATIVAPHAATWTLKDSAQALVMGQKTGTLTFTDGGAGVGGCVQSVALKDATGSTVPVTAMTRTNNTVTVSADPAHALGPTGTAVVAQANGISGAPVSVELLPAMPHVTQAVAYLPKGTLVLQGTGLKYINTVTLERTGIVFGSGSPDPDGSWSFTAQTPATYQPAWEHETMAISYTMQPPDTRSAAVQADVQYAAPN